MIDVVERHLLVAAAGQATPPMVVVGGERHALGRLIHCRPARCARTREPADALVGHGPFVVDALDGSLRMVHRQSCGDGLEWEDQYREKVRGELSPRELDVEVRRLACAGRRLDASKAVRRAEGGLNPADAPRYVDAVAEGTDPPAELASRLPQADTRYLAITPYGGPCREPTHWSGAGDDSSR
ncbi:hypothetical protein [Streptomyces sp. AM8-1-1]|uniref:hypothetical protein n=1 Tax=Streptomyces sp. AM8-1-1 TaxID=3075825 RepID=UPI0028C406F9|nr:hypothetical protein [Streptomyces sp. AM8-1-1]WNO76354.1 hypothetical protein RPQ07_34145 [Streptomyces sp. AM8-1-1]